MGVRRRCPAGHQLAAASAVCGACRVETICTVVRAACPELPAGRVAAAVEATITSTAVARDLAAALKFGPDVLAGGAPPVVGRLVGELRAQGSSLAVPACALCRRTGRPLIRNGTIGICPRCRAHQLAEPCSSCGRLRVVVIRGSDGEALCFARAPPGPALRALRPGPARRPASHRERPRHLQQLFSAAGGHLSFVRASQAVQLRGRRPSDLCLLLAEDDGRLCPLRPATPALRPLARGAVCEPCYRAALSRRGTCERCGQQRRLMSPPGVDARMCADCAGVRPLAQCADCGIEDRLFRDRRCVRCALADRTARLLRGPRPDLLPIHHAIAAARQPYSAHNWLRSAAGAEILGEIASGALPLTHEALDTHRHAVAARFLRQMLVANGVLVARDEALVALEVWVAARLGEVSDAAQRRLLRSYATWRVLRRARTRAAQTPRPRTATRHAKTRLLAAMAFLAWLEERTVALRDCSQADIDLWSCQSQPFADDVKDFLDWAAQRKLVAPLKLTSRRRQEGAAMDADLRWAIVDRLLHDDQLCLTDRVAGCLVMLYGQQLSRIVALTVDQVVTTDDGVYLKLGANQTVLPEPLGGLVIQLATNGRPYTGVGSPARSQWLFPGLHPGRPLHPGGLGQRLRRIDIPTMPGRRAALMHLASQLPAAVLAETLHLQPTTAVRWVAAAGGDWSTYAAQVARDR